MYYEVYIDLIFLINLMLDLLVLKITGSIAKRKSTLFRYFLAAALGSALLCLCILANAGFLWRHSLFAVVITTFLTVNIAFRHKKEKWYKMSCLTLLFYGVSFFLGGIINALCSYTAIGYYMRAAYNSAEEKAVSWRLVCMVALICCCIEKPVIRLVQRIKGTKSLYRDIELFKGGKEVGIRGLVDTGNHLREPISGKPVHVAEISAISAILPQKFAAAVERFYLNGIMEDGLYLDGGIRMIPFRTVGTPKEKLLVAVTIDKMKFRNHAIECEIEKPYVALYDGVLAHDASYHILLHGTEVMKQEGLTC